MGAEICAGGRDASGVRHPLHTLFVIKPTTNDKLLDPTVDGGCGFNTQTVGQLGRLHAVRSVLSLAAFLIFMLL